MPCDTLVECSQADQSTCSMTLGAAPRGFLTMTSSNMRRSILPIEMLDHIIRFLTRSELLPCLRVNRTFYSVSSRILYHTIDELRPLQSVACLLELHRNARIQPFVRHLDIDWNQDVLPTANLYRVLHRTLAKLTSLAYLSIEVPRHQAPLWVLQGCKFSLKHFTTSLPCKQPLAEFLDTQPALTDLTLRGFESDDNSLPAFLTSTPSPTEAGSAFSLLPESLPKLSTLRTVHCGPKIIESVVNNRPIGMASIALFPSRTYESLKALATSSASIKRLSIMSFDPSAQDYLLSELAVHFPDLEALHIVILLSEYNNELLRASGPLLAAFKALQYMTLMAATDEASSFEEEQDIAKLWHHWCPTLKTIILPRGRVWFEGRTQWNSLDDEAVLE